MISHTHPVMFLWPAAECECVCAADIAPPPTATAASAADGAAGGETPTETCRGERENVQYTTV